MKKKELLKLIHELQAKVAILETKIHYSQSPLSTPHTVTTPHLGCQHEYPAGVWGSVIPPRCIKCGHQFPSWTTTAPGSTCSGATGATDTELMEYIQRNTRN